MSNATFANSSSTQADLKEEEVARLAEKARKVLVQANRDGTLEDSCAQFFSSQEEENAAQLNEGSEAEQTVEEGIHYHAEAEKHGKVQQETDWMLDVTRQAESEIEPQLDAIKEARMQSAVVFQQTAEEMARLQAVRALQLLKVKADAQRKAEEEARLQAEVAGKTETEGQRRPEVEAGLQAILRLQVEAQACRTKENEAELRQEEDGETRLQIDLEKNAKVVEEVRLQGETGAAEHEQGEASVQDALEAAFEAALNVTVPSLEDTPRPQNQTANQRSSAPSQSEDSELLESPSFEAHLQKVLVVSPETELDCSDRWISAGDYEWSSADGSFETLLRLRPNGRWWHAAHQQHVADDDEFWEMAESLGIWELAPGILMLQCTAFRWSTDQPDAHHRLRPPKETRIDLQSVAAAGQLVFHYSVNDRVPGKKILDLENSNIPLHVQALGFALRYDLAESAQTSSEIKGFCKSAEENLDNAQVGITEVRGNVDNMEESVTTPSEKQRALDGRYTDDDTPCVIM